MLFLLQLFTIWYLMKLLKINCFIGIWGGKQGRELLVVDVFLWVLRF